MAEKDKTREDDLRKRIEEEIDGEDQPLTEDRTIRDTLPPPSPVPPAPEDDGDDSN